MSFLETLRGSPPLLVAFCALLGLMVGSFLNVVIARLPKMLEARWRGEARELLGLQAEPAAALSLWRPASCCPACRASIRPWQNVPLLSWLWLRGRCAACGTRISVQYPLVELATAAISALCAWRYGYSVPLAGALLLSWALICLAVIDWNTQLLPDDLTLPLLWLGLIFNLGGSFAPLPEAVIGAVAGYLSLWTVFQLFRLLTGKEGMGFGDFKLLAALGAWFGWPLLPSLILISSAGGALVGIALMLFRGHSRSIPIAFGPYIAGAGLVALLAGDWIRGVQA